MKGRGKNKSPRRFTFPGPERMTEQYVEYPDLWNTTFQSDFAWKKYITQESEGKGKEIIDKNINKGRKCDKIRKGRSLKL